MRCGDVLLGRVPAASRRRGWPPSVCARDRWWSSRRVSLMPAQALARRAVHGDPGARAWLYGSAMHGDVPLTAPGSAIAGVYLNLLGHAVGWPSPEGGAGRLTAALVALPARAGRRAPHASRGRRDRRPPRSGDRCSARRRRAARRPDRDRRRDARRAGVARRRVAAATATGARCGATASGRPRSSSTGRSTGRSRGPARRRARRHRARRRRRGQSCSTPGLSAGACPSARSCCSASRRSPTRPARRPAGTPPGPTRHGPQTLDWEARARPPGRADRGAGRALRAGVPRPDPRPARALPRRSPAPQRRT